MKATWLEIVAQVATTVAAVVATVALILGFIQFRETQLLTREALNLQTNTLKHEREAKAIDLFMKFNEIQQEMASQLTKRSRLQTQKEGLFWRQNLSLSITESVFVLTEGDATWRATVVWMLEGQKDFITDLNCQTFSPAFVALAREVTRREVCA